MFKKIITAGLFLISVNLVSAQDKTINVVVIGAHPDDCDLDAGGTAIKFAQLGHRVLFVSTTNGDAGHFNKGGATLAQIKKLKQPRPANALELPTKYSITTTDC